MAMQELSVVLSRREKSCASVCIILTLALDQECKGVCRTMALTSDQGRTEQTQVMIRGRDISVPLISEKGRGRWRETKGGRVFSSCFGILVSSVVHAVVFPLIPQVLGGGTYIRLSGSMGSTSIDSTNCRSKILKNQKDSKKLNLNLQYTGNYLRIIYIVFTSICTAFTLNCK